MRKAYKVLVTGLLALVFCALALIGYGLWLPDTQRVTVELIIQRDSHSLWRQISDMPTQSSWNPSLVSVMPEFPDSTGILSRWVALSDRGLELHFQVDKLFPPETLSVRWESRGKQDINGRWIWTLEPQPEQSTKVQLVEEITVQAPLSRIYLRHYPYRQLARLKKTLEGLQKQAAPAPSH